MQFLLDEDVNPAVAEIARGLGMAVISVHEIGRRQREDDDQLRFSTLQERIFVTRNRNDFHNLNIYFFQIGEPHAGILIVPNNLPNKLPARIAHALKRWQEGAGNPGLSFIAYLSP